MTVAGLATLAASGYSEHWISSLAACLGLVALAAVLCLAAIARANGVWITAAQSERRSARAWLLLGAFLLVHVVTAVILERSVPANDIDTFTFQQAAVSDLLHGVDPYGSTRPNVFLPKDTPIFYAPGMVVDGRVQVGFQYPPLTVLWAIPGYLLGDVRYSYILAVMAAAVLCFVAFPRNQGLWLAAFLLVNPIAFDVENRCWTEPLVFLMLCVTLYAAIKRRWWLPVALGLFLATKQYNFLAVPFVGFLMPPAKGRQGWKLLAIAALVILATLLPFALWNWHGLWRDLVLFHLAQPFRADALSFAVVLPQAMRAGPLMVLGVIAWMLLSKRQGVALFAAGYGLCLLVFVATSKQAFCNYYFLIGETLLLAAAAMAASAAPAGEMA